MPDSSELRITTSRYYTPSGKCIQKPYGDSINYENDLLERIENGELTNNDSITDESKFKGGIMPDIYSPLDTVDYNEQVNKIIYTKKWRDFCFKYYEKYPTIKFNDVKEFYFNFNLKNNELEKFLNTNFSDLIKLDASTLKDLEWSLKIELSSYYFSDQARYIINTFKDPDIEKAINTLTQ